VPAAVLSTRDTDVSYVTDQPPAGDEHAITMAPDLIQLVMKTFIVIEMSELLGQVVVSLEIEVRRRCDDEMNTVIRNPFELSGIT
jgi:hypothetical protein